MNMNQVQARLLGWFQKNKRSLPWRESKNPYFIWISEVMLQQTTVNAVIPFFMRFKERFPTVQELAKSELTEVLEYWAGLGYYSRARNLHRAAQVLSQLPQFPCSYLDLKNLPGFGDYTSRAVSSIAFNEPVGVVDGNVIRILSRLYGEPFQWWSLQGKSQLQTLSDQLAQAVKPSDVNEAMMELGATVCTPTSPACPLCPWSRQCIALKKNSVSELPIKRPRPNKQIVSVTFKWLMNSENELALVESKDLPFLKNSLLPPLEAKWLSKKPKKFDFQHSITKYQIFVTVERLDRFDSNSNYRWCPIDRLSRANPSSLLLKASKLYQVQLESRPGHSN